MMEVTRDVARFADFCLEVELAAADAYLRFVYDNIDRARALLRYLGEKQLLESSAPFGHVLVHDGAPLAMAAVLPGAELRKLRMRVALAMQKAGDLRPDDVTMKRIQLAHGVLLRPEDSDFYLSRIGVAPGARGSGAAPLIANFITCEAKIRGFTRATAEVHPANIPMMKLMCEKVGWHPIGEHSVTDPVTGRSLQYSHLVKDC